MDFPRDCWPPCAGQQKISPEQRRPFHMPLPGPRPGKVQKLKVTLFKIHTGGQGPAQLEPAFPVIVKHGASGQHIARRIDTVGQRYRHAAYGIA